eukprot:6614725-Prymnesium_polylepis.1
MQRSTSGPDRSSYAPADARSLTVSTPRRTSTSAAGCATGWSTQLSGGAPPTGSQHTSESSRAGGAGGAGGAA